MLDHLYKYCLENSPGPLAFIFSNLHLFTTFVNCYRLCTRYNRLAELNPAFSECIMPFVTPCCHCLALNQPTLISQCCFVADVHLNGKCNAPWLRVIEWLRLKGTQSPFGQLIEFQSLSSPHLVPDNRREDDPKKVIWDDATCCMPNLCLLKCM